MPGTFGKSDIWFVYIYDDEQYSQPINLGPNVNTEFRESFPFIDDSFTLFYSSDGRMVLGGFDVFSAKLNSRGFPSKSKNLGIYKHGFFLRLGGVSKSYYTSLNCGYSSNDNYKNIMTAIRPTNSSLRDKIDSDGYNATLNVINSKCTQ